MSDLRNNKWGASSRSSFGHKPVVVLVPHGTRDQAIAQERSQILQSQLDFDGSRQFQGNRAGLAVFQVQDSRASRVEHTAPKRKRFDASGLHIVHRDPKSVSFLG